MRVLLAAKYIPSGPRPIGGVQSWIVTVRAELERMGHEVAEWQPNTRAPKGRFDLGVFANAHLTRHLKTRCDRAVCVSHGIIPDERPALGMHTFCVSEGVRDHWGGGGAILRQPIDTGFWRPTGAQRHGVVRYSYRGSHTLCEAVALHLGQPYRHVYNATAEEARDMLAGAALVFASGRAALEAMACGAITVIYDHRSAYQGPLADHDIERQMRNSYSGRGGINPTLPDLVEMIAQAKPRRDWVESHHTARWIVQELIA